MKVDHFSTLFLKWVLVKACLIEIIARTGLFVLLRWDLCITVKRGGRFVSGCFVEKLSAFTLCSLMVIHSSNFYLLFLIDYHVSEVCQYQTWRTTFPMVETSIFKVHFSFRLYYLLSFRWVIYRKGWHWGMK